MTDKSYAVKSVTAIENNFQRMSCPNSCLQNNKRQVHNLVKSRNKVNSISLNNKNVIVAMTPSITENINLVFTDSSEKSAPTVIHNISAEDFENETNKILEDIAVSQNVSSSPLLTNADGSCNNFIQCSHNENDITLDSFPNTRYSNDDQHLQKTLLDPNYDTNKILFDDVFEVIESQIQEEGTNLKNGSNSISGLENNLNMDGSCSYSKILPTSHCDPAAALDNSLWQLQLGAGYLPAVNSIKNEPSDNCLDHVDYVTSVRPNVAHELSLQTGFEFVSGTPNLMQETPSASEVVSERKSFRANCTIGMIKISPHLMNDAYVSHNSSGQSPNDKFPDHSLPGACLSSFPDGTPPGQYDNRLSTKNYWQQYKTENFNSSLPSNIDQWKFPAPSDFDPSYEPCWDLGFERIEQHHWAIEENFR